MKTKEELKNLKNEFETLNRKLAELSEEELSLVIGGAETNFIAGGGQRQKIAIAQSPIGGLSGSADGTVGGTNVGMVPGIEDVSGSELDV